MINEKLTSDRYTFEIKEEILYVDFGNDVEIDLQYAKDLVKDRLDFLQGREFLSVADASKVRKINKEARDYFSSDKARTGVKAIGLISDNAMTNMLANFFIRVNVAKPKVPTKLFSKKNDAVKWLRSI